MGRRRKVIPTSEQPKNFPSVDEKSLDEIFGETTTSTVVEKEFSTIPEADILRIKKSAKSKKDIQEVIKEIPEIFTPDQVKFVFDLYTGILAFVFSLVLNTEFSPIFDELKFEDDAKDVMAKPLAKICSKYAPNEWAGMQAEIELIAMLGLYTITSFSRAKNVAEKEAKKLQEENRKRQQQRNTPTNQTPIQPTVVPVNV